jgi:threonine/homoserine/homoserine lactone efflux protein
MPNDINSVTLPTIFAASFFIGLISAITPSPLLAITIIESARQGLKSVLYLMWGHSLIDLIAILLLVFSLEVMQEQSQLLFLISIPGGLYLAWLAWQTYKTAPKATQILNDSVARTKVTGGWAGSSRLLFLGAIVSVSNPYWGIWWVTAGANQISVALEAGLIGITSFWLGHILADFGWYGAIGLSLSQGRALMSERTYTGLLRGAAALLGFLGVMFILLGLRMALGNQQ